VSRESIIRCISIVREVTKVFWSLPFMAVWPLMGVAWYMFIIFYGILIGGFIVTTDQNTFASIASVVEAQTNGTSVDVSADAFSQFTDLSSSTQQRILLVIHLVGCIWALYITQCSVYTTLSRSAAVWFFSHGPDESGQVVQKGTFYCGLRVVLVCAYCVIARHLGSIAFGAAILTIMTILRLILQAIDHYTKDMQQSNFLLKVCMKCVQCCLWCMDKTVKFITFYGFIFVAIEGSSFCGACMSTFGFIMKYPAQMTVNRLVAQILSFVISLSIPAAAASIAFMWVDSLTESEGPLSVAGTVFLMAFTIASAVTDVFRCCIDTVFVCAFKDMEDNTPPKFMSQSLQTGFGLDDIEKKEDGVELTKAKEEKGKLNKEISGKL